MGLLENEVSAVEKLLAPVRVQAVRLDVPQDATPVKGKGSGLILLKDTAAEFGNPQNTSAGLLLYTNEAGDGAVRLLGSDVPALVGKSVSFAMITVLHGRELTAENFYQIQTRFQRYADFPGWQVRVAKERIWVRAARIATGLPDFAFAAATFINRVKADFPTVESVDIWYVTENDDLVKALAATATTVLASSHAIKEGVWKERGFDYKSCQLAGHCGGCADKKTCASVRTMEARIRVNRRKHGIDLGEHQ